MKKLCWGARVSPEFRAKLFEIVAGFGWRHDQASDLMACMAFETGGTFSPKVKNMAGSGAVGLIQFMPATAEYLGTTTEALAAMSAEDQLDYVWKHFKPYAKKIKNLADMYMAILMPKYVGASDMAVLFSTGTAYRQNSGLDSDKDGKITKLEASVKVLSKYRQGLQEGNFSEY